MFLKLPFAVSLSALCIYSKYIYIYIYINIYIYTYIYTHT